MVSSEELHPASGARFVCEREAGETLRYRATVYVAGGATVEAVVSWDAGGQVVLAPAPADAWVREELVKLARVLRRGDRARLHRWRG